MDEWSGAGERSGTRPQLAKMDGKLRSSTAAYQPLAGGPAVGRQLAKGLGQGEGGARGRERSKEREGVAEV